VTREALPGDHWHERDFATLPAAAGPQRGNAGTDRRLGAALPSVRRRHDPPEVTHRPGRRIHWLGDVELGAQPRHRAAADRAGQAEPERVRGVLQHWAGRHPPSTRSNWPRGRLQCQPTPDPPATQSRRTPPGPQPGMTEEVTVRVGLALPRAVCEATGREAT